MVQTIYFDCISGISGDMALGALLNLGLSLTDLRTALASLSLPEWEITSTREMRGYLAGTYTRVQVPKQTQHRHLADIQSIINASSLSERIKEQSMRVFTLLAEAEGLVHGVSPEEVHFHEVGALDAIVDIVGVVTGLELLGVERVFASALPLGTGWVHAAHGWLPVPAPAVLYLLAQAHAPTLPDETPAELVTPTGAALLAALATFQRPTLRLQRVGYGLGTRNLERPNALRAWLGEIMSHPGVPG